MEELKSSKIHVFIVGYWTDIGEYWHSLAL